MSTYARPSTRPSTTCPPIHGSAYGDATSPSGSTATSRPEHFLDPGALVAMFVDIVAKGGNLLLNVGPRGEDASIPDQQLQLLDALGSWTSGPGSTVFGSRPWVRPGCSTPSGRELRFWTRDRSTFVAIGPRPGAGAAPGPGPAGPGSAEGIRIPGVAPTPTTEVLDDSGAAVPHERLEGGLRLVTRLGEGVRWPVFELRDCRPA
ncbi:MAG: alpha-L-fucosidase [Microthrixaceae bacterium]